ncbi:MAG: VOC family protein [Paracoccaceae bacterium]
MRFVPYLNFDGTTAEAMQFYKAVFGGTLTLMRFGDMPDAEPEMPHADRTMHATLALEGAVLMASDLPPGYEGQTTRGVNISFDTSTRAEAERIFSALSDGGNVMMPLSETFWSPCFGMVTDRFGISWMIATGNMPT